MPNVAFDSDFEKGSASTASPFSFVSNAGTVPGSVGANSNRVLIAVVGFPATRTAVAVTWNGVAMTQIGSEAHNAVVGQVWMFGLIAPATGANTLSVSWSGGNSVVVLGGLSLYNVDQTTGWQNAGSDTGTGTTATSTITSQSGNIGVVGIVDNNSSGGPTISVGSNAWTETNFSGNYAQGLHAASGATTDVTWTLGSSVEWHMLKVDVISVDNGTPVAASRVVTPFAAVSF